MRTIIHVDFNSYFATVEQQANPRLRGKPIGVTGGDRLSRTVLGAASVEAKARGVKTGMTIPEALKLCPDLILVKGDSDKYLECTKRFLNILKDYSPYLEIFSIDEVFLEMSHNDARLLTLATQIKQRIKAEVGEWIRCSIGISYSRVLAKLAGSLYKPDGLNAILDSEAAMMILDQIELDEVCGIGPRIKKRLFSLGITNFKKLREVPLNYLLASFKSYGNFLYNIARGVDNSPITPFYEKEEVKSIGHRYTISHDTNDELKIKQILLKLTELIARKLRSKKLVGKTISCWFRYSALHPRGAGSIFMEDGMQTTINFTDDGLDIFKAGWGIFKKLWDQNKIRMIGVSISNLKPKNPENLSFLEELKRREIITRALDLVNDRYGEFTVQRGVLANSSKIRRRPNPFMADYRFKI